MTEKYKDIEFILEDEFSFTKAKTNIAGIGQFYSNDVDQTPVKLKKLIKPNTKTKF